MSACDDFRLQEAMFRGTLEQIREAFVETVIRPMVAKAVAEVLEDPAKAGMVQYRFPRSKKMRIRKKWRRRIENWRFPEVLP